MTKISDGGFISPEIADQVYQQMLVSSAMKRRTLVLNEFVDEVSMYKIAYNMDRLKDIDDSKGIPMKKREPIIIEMSSGGGSCLDGLFLISKIESFKKMGYTIITRVNGYACSMAFMILVVGSVRQMYSRSKAMFHQPSSSEYGYKTLQQKEEDTEELKVIWEEMKDICKQYTKMTDSMMSTIKKEKLDAWYGAKEALDLHIIDEII